MHRLTRSLKTLGRCVGRRSRSAIARQAIKDVKIRNKVIELIGKLLAKELTITCSVDANSSLRNRNPDVLEKFRWSDLLTELKETAPTMVSLLKSAISSNKSGLRSPNTDAITALCCSILLRARSQRMNLIQRLLSVILYGGHASKQVYTRLQKLLLCLSHKSTLSFIDKLGEGYDTAVHRWREDIKSRKLQADQQPVDVASDHEKDSISKITEPCESKQQLLAYTSASNSSECSTKLSIERNASQLNQDSASCSTSQETTSSSSVTSSINIVDIFGNEASLIPTEKTPKTFKLVMDNIDKNIKPNQMRIDKQTKSLHYMHKYAVRDRIDLSSFTDRPSLPDISKIKVSSILPSVDDQSAIKKNFAVLIARVLVQNLPFFKDFGSGVERHIRHKFTHEMTEVRSGTTWCFIEK